MTATLMTGFVIEKMRKMSSASSSSPVAVFFTPHSST